MTEEKETKQKKQKKKLTYDEIQENIKKEQRSTRRILAFSMAMEMPITFYIKQLVRAAHGAFNTNFWVFLLTHLLTIILVLAAALIGGALVGGTANCARGTYNQYKPYLKKSRFIGVYDVIPCTSAGMLAYNGAIIYYAIEFCEADWEMWTTFVILWIILSFFGSIVVYSPWLLLLGWSVDRVLVGPNHKEYFCIQEGFGNEINKFENKEIWYFGTGGCVLL